MTSSKQSHQELSLLCLQGHRDRFLRGGDRKSQEKGRNEDSTPQCLGRASPPWTSHPGGGGPLAICSGWRPHQSHHLPSLLPASLFLTESHIAPVGLKFPGHFPSAGHRCPVSCGVGDRTHGLMYAGRPSNQSTILLTKPHAQL